MTKLPAEAYAIIEGRHSDPFHYLGLHTEGNRSVVRAFLPNASNVEAIGEHGETAPLTRIHDAGLFAGPLPNGSMRYQLRARFGDRVVELEDAYRFPPILSDFDLYLLGEGTHQRIYDTVGGIGFVVLAPNARRVSVVGDFNFWDGRRHPMRVRGSGYWELFIPRARVGDHYKYEVVGPNGQLLALKSDPLAFAAEVRPKTASIVIDERSIPHPRSAPENINALRSPVSIYEVHLGSWRRKGRNEWLTYRDMAEQLPAYARDMGFTHIEVLPITDHPFRFARRFRRAGRRLPSRGARRAARLGPRALPRRSARPRPLRRHRALRARQPAAGPPSRLGHADLQLRAHRGHQLPGLERAVLARPLRYRRPARRRRRLDALSRLQPSRRRLDPEQIWRPGKHRSDRFPAPLQYRGVCALSAGDHGGRGIHRMAAGVTSGRIWRARLRLQMEHGVDARHAEIYRQGSHPPQIPSRRYP